MGLVSFLSSHLRTSEQSRFSRPVIRIAVVSVALSVTVMIVAIAVVTGFQREIRDKVIGFGSHIQITRYDHNLSLEQQPFQPDQQLIHRIGEISGVRKVQSFATKAGIIKTSDQILGVVFKGVDKNYDWNFFDSKLITGRHLHFNDTLASDDIMISAETSRKLGIRCGDKLRMYFLVEGEAQPRGRKFTVAGIYDSGIGEMDRMFVIGDIKHVVKLNNWQAGQVGGLEVLVNDFDRLNFIGKDVYKTIDYNLNSETIRDLYPQIFDWLKLLDGNVQIILVLMTIVSVMTMISTLLILILERTSMIGLLKSMGARNSLIRRLFLVLAMRIMFLGLFWGNLVGLGLCLIQYKMHWLKLSPDSYYVSYVPVNLVPTQIILLNIGAAIICLVILILPSMVITRISPVRAIRYT